MLPALDPYLLYRFRNLILPQLSKSQKIMGYEHYDLHSGNVMQDKQGNIKLIDFGDSLFKDTFKYQQNNFIRKLLEE